MVEGSVTVSGPFLSAERKEIAHAGGSISPRPDPSTVARACRSFDGDQE
jgi:hypothetical protein